MIMSELISIMIPMYNAEEKIEKCIKSILKQTYKNIELIIVDDGSKDNSFMICNKLKESDSRIKIIKQLNSGEGAARNTGIENATGKYLCFVDADDYVKEDFVEVLYNLIKEDKNVNMGICGFIEIKDEKIINETSGEFKLLSQEEAMEELLKETSFKGYVWNKIFNLSIIKENNLKFDTTLSVWTDVCFVFMYLKFVNKIAFHPIPEYYYIYMENSVSHTQNHILGVEKSYSAIRAKDIIFEDIPKNYEKVYKQIKIRYIKSALSVIRNIGYTNSLDNKVYLKKSMEIIKRYNNEVWRYLTKKEKILVMICKISPGILLRLYRLKK